MAQQMADGVYLIDTKPMGVERIIASYLVVGSGATALIDPGFSCSVDTNIEAIKELGIEPDAIDYIVQTHCHIDHAGGVGQLAQLAGRAKVTAHQRGAFYLKNSMKIGGGGHMVFGSEMMAELGEPIDVAGDRIKTIGDGDVIDLGDKNLRVFYTPGHSGDHVSLLEESTGMLFPGDTACLQYPDLGHVLIPAGSPPIYQTDHILSELTTLAGCDVKCVLTPHFGSGEGAPDEFLKANIDTVRSDRDRIDAMFKRGMEFPQVVEQLRSEIIEQSGRSPEEIPKFISDVWLRIMLKTGLMGLVADLLQYARDLRPFSHTAGSQEVAK
ncbi:MAG: MBL fold metallo-hydrolase [Phycisphaerae bacterium]|jgi:glyoxylase-like metal-dependent hydrolase (beta-lactamase superfamily II)|nr:MBL fold metallo-hydrolase [Phycisphaerae bacterium]